MSDITWGLSVDGLPKFDHFLRSLKLAVETNGGFSPLPPPCGFAIGGTKSVDSTVNADT